jgi:two-component system probable response regulator PhcQ
MMLRILLLDDEKNVLAALKRSLRQIYSEQELDIETFTDAKAAIQRFASINFNFVMSDYHMPIMNGVDFLCIIKEIQPLTVRMMLSASADFKTAIGAINEAEVFRYIPKPWVQDELNEVMQLALIHYHQVVTDRSLADQVRAQQNPMSEEEKEAQKLEQSEPGITQVNWGPDGSVHVEVS